MRRFQRRLEERATDPASRRWLFVPYDQLTDRVGPLSREDPTKLGVVLVENRWQSRRRPYHKQKLALLLANQRQFALEQAARGVAVRYVVSDEPFRHVLAPIAAELGPLRMMEAAERELRADVEPLVAAGNLRVIPHEGWLTTRSDFLASQPPSGPWLGIASRGSQCTRSLETAWPIWSQPLPASLCRWNRWYRPSQG